MLNKSFPVKSRQSINQSICDPQSLRVRAFIQTTIDTNAEVFTSA